MLAVGTDVGEFSDAEDQPIRKEVHIVAGSHRGVVRERCPMEVLEYAPTRKRQSGRVDTGTHDCGDISAAANTDYQPGHVAECSGDASGMLARRCDPGATLTPPMSSENETRDALAREMYWAEEATPRSKMDTAAVRDALHDFALLMRDDEKQVIPRGEPNLASRRRYRRRLKVRMFRLFRPISWRYDRLLADLGELNAALADRVAELEAEVDRLRAEQPQETEHKGDDS